MLSHKRHTDELRVTNSNLNTKLATDVGKLTRLRKYWTGAKTRSYTKLPVVGALHLNDARFLGHIPTELAKLTNLQSLQLHSNDFVGSIPNRLSSLKLLSKLGNRNCIYGPI